MSVSVPLLYFRRLTKGILIVFHFSLALLIRVNTQILSADVSQLVAEKPQLYLNTPWSLILAL